MTERTTIRHVAELASVSLGTVSRVINQEDSVRPELRARVLEAMEQLGYRPNAAAQSMRSGRTKIIGCMVTYISHPIFSSMLAAAETVLREAGYSIVFAQSSDRPAREIEVFDFFQRMRVDGIITTVGKDDDEETVRRLNTLDIPVVLTERRVAGHFDSVVSDHGGGCYVTTSHLLNLGHRRVALFTSPASIFPGRERRKHFIRAHQDAGVPVDPELMVSWVSSFEFGSGFTEIFSLLNTPRRPTALIVGVMELPSVLRAVQTLGLRIPTDLSIIALGDSDLAELASPRITVVRWPTEQVGNIAAQCLLRRLRGKAPPELSAITLPSELVLRESCAPPPPAA